MHNVWIDCQNLNAAHEKTSANAEAFRDFQPAQRTGKLPR